MQQHLSKLLRIIIGESHHPWGTGYRGMYCCEGYGFQTVKSKKGYRMKSESLAHFPENWSIGWRF